MDTEPPMAESVYDVELVARSRGRLPKLASAVGQVTTALIGGLLDLPFHGDLVVRHRAGGTEALRIPVDTREEASLMLTEVEDQLATQSAQAFRARWGLE